MLARTHSRIPTLRLPWRWPLPNSKGDILRKATPTRVPDASGGRHQRLSDPHELNMPVQQRGQTRPFTKYMVYLELPIQTTSIMISETCQCIHQVSSVVATLQRPLVVRSLGQTTPILLHYRTAPRRALQAHLALSPPSLRVMRSAESRPRLLDEQCHQLMPGMSDPFV